MWTDFRDLWWFFCCGKWMFETIGWGMNYPNEDDGGWVDAMCWQLLVSLDLSRSFTEFPESTNFKTIWLFEEFHLIHDTSQGQQLSFFLWFQSCWLQTWGERYWGPWGHNQNLRAAKIDRKIQAHLRGFQDSGNSKFLRVLAALFFLKNQRQGFLCYFRSSTAKFWDIPSTWRELCWKLVENSLLHCMIPFFSPHIHRIKKYQNPSLGKKTNPSIQSQKPLPRLSDPGRFFLFCF